MYHYDPRTKLTPTTLLSNSNDSQKYYELLKYVLSNDYVLNRNINETLPGAKNYLKNTETHSYNPLVHLRWRLFAEIFNS